MEASPQWESMKNKLASMADRVEIKNIVCIALDTVSSPRDSGAHQRVFTSMLSRFLREQYIKKQNFDSPVIKICAYDPSYQQKDLVMLEKFFPPISVLSNPYHFLAIDEHTLVLCAFCPAYANNFELTADVPYPSGPAALITNEIWDDMPWFAEQKLYLLDVWTPRVGEMLAQYTKEDLYELGWVGFEPLEPWYWLSTRGMTGGEDALKD